MLQCIGMCLDMLLQVYVRVSRYVFWICCYRSVTVSRYVFVCCYRSMLVSRYVFVYVVTGLC